MKKIGQKIGLVVAAAASISVLGIIGYQEFEKTPQVKKEISQNVEKTPEEEIFQKKNTGLDIYWEKRRGFKFKVENLKQNGDSSKLTGTEKKYEVENTGEESLRIFNYDNHFLHSSSTSIIDEDHDGKPDEIYFSEKGKNKAKIYRDSEKILRYDMLNETKAKNLYNNSKKELENFKRDNKINERMNDYVNKLEELIN